MVAALSGLGLLWLLTAADGLPAGQMVLDPSRDSFTISDLSGRRIAWGNTEAIEAALTRLGWRERRAN